MKKFLSIVAVAAISLFTVSAFAQTDRCSADTTKCTKQCKARKDKCTKRQAHNPFEGLNLTQEQQTAIAAIPTPLESIREAKKACKSDTTKCDCKQMRQVVKDIRTNYLSQIKEILTPEQYNKFLENSYVSQTGGKNKADRKMKADNRHSKKGCKNDGRKCKKQGKPSKKVAQDSRDNKVS